MATGGTQEFLSVKELEERYPEEWLLLVDCELTEITELSGGRWPCIASAATTSIVG